MVSEEVVVGAGAAGDNAGSYCLPRDGQGDADGLGGEAGVFHFVVGEGVFMMVLLVLISPKVAMRVCKVKQNRKLFGLFDLCP